MSKLQPHFFSNMNRLLWLNISHNDVSEIHGRIFARNSLLRVLHMNNNKLTRYFFSNNWYKCLVHSIFFFFCSYRPAIFVHGHNDKNMIPFNHWKLSNQTSYWSKTGFSFSVNNHNKFSFQNMVIISYQNNVPKYRTKGHEQVWSDQKTKKISSPVCFLSV